MFRIRMISGMAATAVDAVKGPVLVMRKFICAGSHTVIGGLCIAAKTALGGLCIAAKAVWRVVWAIAPQLAVVAMVSISCYLGYLIVRDKMETTAMVAEATKHEIAFKNSLKHAADTATDLNINNRILAMIASSGESIRGSGKFSSLDGVPDKQLKYGELEITVNPPQNLYTSHRMRLMSMWSATGRGYISVEVDGEQAYLCVSELNESGAREYLCPWVYRGIGVWEYLLESAESVVDGERQQQEISLRFGNLEEVR